MSKNTARAGPCRWHLVVIFVYGVVGTLAARTHKTVGEWYNLNCYARNAGPRLFVASSSVHLGNGTLSITVSKRASAQREPYREVVCVSRRRSNVPSYGILCPLNAERPDPKASWQFHGRDRVENPARRTVRGRGLLDFSNLMDEDEGLYKCTVTTPSDGEIEEMWNFSRKSGRWVLSWTGAHGERRRFWLAKRSQPAKTLTPRTGASRLRRKR
ncbi:hypothetical protein BIW11_08467 [Tropilaelaps mercedesae]|uniref:Ig-like domain-containing protein n=1 Tax=Tropilaelaps mercedesae TaxID=418985 RepID=A0A1V9XPU6_9ACAR|nr:hypothetical protein BIW11_08467 [Tropilaelaps mercedesae]